MKIRYKESSASTLQFEEGLTSNPQAHQIVPLLRLENISKRFSGTLALDNVCFDIHPGEVHAIFGENGAGKSTLIQIAAGDIQPTTGKIFLNNEELKIHSVHHARELGISAVFQEFSLIPQMSVEENLFLGSEMLMGPFLKKGHLRQLAYETLERFGFDIKPQKKVMHLSRAEQQMVEITKAIRTKPSIMILDEPTTTLTEQETNQLFSMIKILKEEGIGIIYITHRTSEIYRICDRITILRDGKLISAVSVSETNEEKLLELTFGSHIQQPPSKTDKQPGKVLLDIKGLTLANQIDDVSINVRAGEIVGITGLVGSGKSEVGRACFGLEKIRSGYISYLDDQIYNSTKHINDLSPRAMLDRGMLYLPSNRRVEGLVMLQNVRENLTLPSLGLPKFSRGLGFLLHLQKEKDIVGKVAQRLGLNQFDIESCLEHLSGGNQQKVMVAKSFVRDVKLLILDEPTVGVDVGARASIYQLIRDVCDTGAGVLLISSDLSEIMHWTHRAYVMHRGELRAELDHNELTKQTLVSYFSEKKEDTA